MASATASKRLIIWALAMTIVGVALAWALYLARTVILVVYAAAILAIGFSPVVERLERIRLTRKRSSRLPRWLAILIVYLTLIGLFVAVLAILLPTFIEQARAMWQAVPGMLDRVETQLVRWHLLTRKWTMTELLSKPTADSTMSGVMTALTAIIGGIVGVVSMLILGFYMLVETASIKAGLLRLVPRDERTDTARIVDDVTTKVAAWLLGQITVAAVMGATATIALWLIGVPYFYVLGLMVGLGEFVPIVGPLIAASPAVFIAAGESPQKAAIVGVYLLFQHVIEANFVVPGIMKQRVGISALTVVIALLIGASILGVVGALLAIPTAAIAQVLILEYLDRRDARST